MDVGRLGLIDTSTTGIGEMRLLDLLNDLGIEDGLDEDNDLFVGLDAVFDEFRVVLLICPVCQGDHGEFAVAELAGMEQSSGQLFTHLSIKLAFAPTSFPTAGLHMLSLRLLEEEEHWGQAGIVWG